MTQQKDNRVAQGVFLAQLEAVKGTCQCKTCLILRKISDDMTEQFLQPEPTETAIKVP